MKKTLATILLGSTLLFSNSEKTQREVDVVTHRSGNQWSFPALIDNDYKASGEQSLSSTIETNTNDKVKGGFNEDLKLMSHYGTFSNTIDDKSIEDFIQKNKKNMNADAIPFVKDIAKDKYVFNAFEQFFTDNGTISKRGEGSFGHYEDKELQLKFSSGKDSLDAKRILFHELLHYVFDKQNNTLSEVNDGSGADHYIIKPLEDRFRIMHSISKGKLPLNKEIDILYGYSEDEKAGDKINYFIENNDISGLRTIIESSQFYKGLVHNGMIQPISLRADNLEHQNTKSYTPTIENLQDIANQNAYNASLIQQSLLLAIDESEKTNIPLKKAFETPEIRAKFFSFAEKYAKDIEKEKLPNKSAYRLMNKYSNQSNDELIGTNIPIEL